MHPMNGGPNAQEAITMACIMDCPTITVQAGKHYKALIDSRSSNFTSPLFNLSTYWWILTVLRPLYEPTTAKLNTTDGSDTMIGLRYDSFTSKNSRFQKDYPQLCDLWTGYQWHGNYFWHRHSEEVFMAFIPMTWDKEKKHVMAYKLKGW